jgi:hypothetical protein
MPVVESQSPPRRIKSYSAATGYVYQYVFHHMGKARRGLARGTEYVYMVSTDRKTTFPLGIFVRRDAVERWSRAARRALSGTEEYAVAKMRLFQAFDEMENVTAETDGLTVDESNLPALLSLLDV